MSEYLFIEIDMRNDFSDDPRAALPVEGMLALVGKMAVLEWNARKLIIAGDFHKPDDPLTKEEFETFPPHCIPGTWGYNRVEGLVRYHTVKDALVSKNTYDVWKGMGDDDFDLMQLLGGDDRIVVGGVVTGICVKAFIDGAIQRNIADRVTVIHDCVADLDVLGVPQSPELFLEWAKLGVDICSFKTFVKRYVDEEE